MIDKMANQIAVAIKKNVPDHPTSIAVMKHSLSFVLNTVFIISLSLLIALFTNRISEAALALLTYAILRQVSGGAHLKSGMLCVVVSTLMITVISLMSFNAEIVLILNVITVILALVLSPKIHRRTRIKLQYYPLLKMISVLIICTNFYFESPVLATAFFIQTLSLIPRRR
jgi:accessory gene regulator B